MNNNYPVKKIHKFIHKSLWNLNQERMNQSTNNIAHAYQKHRIRATFCPFRVWVSKIASLKSVSPKISSSNFHFP
jgi:hypothetical protein